MTFFRSLWHDPIMTLTLWGRPNSINVQKALWCLLEIGQPFERIDAGREFGINGTPDYRAMNPNGLVPTLRDGDFVLWESNAIVRYLSTKFSRDALASTDPHVFADADRWMDWQQTVLNPALGPAFHGLVRSPGSRPQTEIDASLAATEAAMTILDAHLDGREFLAGDDFSMAEGVVGATVHRWLAMPVARHPRPAIERWYAALMARPAARRAFILPIT